MKEVIITCDNCAKRLDEDSVPITVSSDSPITIESVFNLEVVTFNEAHFCGTRCYTDFTIGKDSRQAPELPTIALYANESDPLPVQRIQTPTPTPTKTYKRHNSIKDTYYFKNKFAQELGFKGVADAFGNMEKADFEKKFQEHLKESNNGK